MAIGQFSGLVTFSAETTKDVDVSASIDDAQQSVATVYDNANNVTALAVQAISKTTFRITSGIPITGTYRLVVVGIAATVTTFSPDSFTPPTLAAQNIYSELRTKLLQDLDLQEETFILPNELIGYFNEGIKEAESEIIKIDEDYFLTSAPIPLVIGKADYVYPDNIYAYKVRHVSYTNGSVIYPVERIHRQGKFETMAFANQYGSADDYRWYHANNSAGQARMNIMPASRETAILSPDGNQFAPMTVWYIRRASRIPLLGQFVKNWAVVDQANSVDATADTITTKSTFVTGDAIQLTTSGVMPGGTVAGTTYYAIVAGAAVKLATSLVNALAGTAIDITTKGLGTLSISIAATQTIVDNTVIDIPEFSEFVIQWVKCRCLEKDFGDPRLAGAVTTLQASRKQMVDTLTVATPDDDDLIGPDFSFYTGSS